MLPVLTMPPFNIVPLVRVARGDRTLRLRHNCDTTAADLGHGFCLRGPVPSDSEGYAADHGSLLSAPRPVPDNTEVAMTVTHYPSLESLAGSEHRTASWWASVARALDDLDDRLAQDAAIDDGPTGAFVDAITREPSLSNEADRLRIDHARLVERARRLRRLVSRVAGDEREATAVAEELAAIAAAENRHRIRSRSLFWDSFTRDIGGE